MKANKANHYFGGHFRGQVRTLSVIALVGSAAIAASPPAWWSANSVLSNQPGTTPDDYAAANLGQLKTIARKAADALDASFPGGAGHEISPMIAAFQVGSTAGHDDYAAVSVGQAKSVAKKFYDRLGIAAPWPAQSNAGTDDFALINVGQLKTLFAFEIPVSDLDNDGIPDLWEIDNGLDPNDPLDALSDLDQDGIAAVDEYRFGLSLTTNDVTVSGRTSTGQYDNLGRLVTVTRGTGTTAYTNDAEGNLEGIAQ